MEFVDTDFDSPPTQAEQSISKGYRVTDSIPMLVENILRDYAFGIPYVDLHRDATRVAFEIQTHLHAVASVRTVERIEMLRSIFYRNRRAYLIGRLFSGTHLLPFVLALMNTPEGIAVDAALLDEDDVSIVFSFTRSYFHVDTERPYDLVHFLKSIMPRKKSANCISRSGITNMAKPNCIAT